VSPCGLDANHTRSLLQEDSATSEIAEVAAAELLDLDDQRRELENVGQILCDV
jgi:hypothetical protein